jgi:hypothetical protein
MLTLLDGAAGSARTVASLRAACEALRAGSSRVSAVSVSGRLPAVDGAALPVLSAAERLAAEFGCAVTMRLDGGTFQVRFTRSAATPELDPGEAG